MTRDVDFIYHSARSATEHVVGTNFATASGFIMNRSSAARGRGVDLVPGAYVSARLAGVAITSKHQYPTAQEIFLGLQKEKDLKIRSADLTSLAIYISWRVAKATTDPLVGAIVSAATKGLTYAASSLYLAGTVKSVAGTVSEASRLFGAFAGWQSEIEFRIAAEPPEDSGWETLERRLRRGLWTFHQLSQSLSEAHFNTVGEQTLKTSEKLSYATSAAVMTGVIPASVGKQSDAVIKNYGKVAKVAKKAMKS